MEPIDQKGESTGQKPPAKPGGNPYSAEQMPRAKVVTVNPKDWAMLSDEDKTAVTRLLVEWGVIGESEEPQLDPDAPRWELDWRQFDAPLDDQQVAAPAAAAAAAPAAVRRDNTAGGQFERNRKKQCEITAQIADRVCLQLHPQPGPARNQCHQAVRNRAELCKRG